MALAGALPARHPPRQRHACSTNDVGYNESMRMETINLVVVLGPTASGKTRLAVALSRLLGGEIVSADSRQVYRELNLGAGKDLDEYRAGGAPVPYHLIDIVDLSKEFNVFEYQRRFFETFDAILKREALPLMVGGTGLFIESVLRGYRMVEVPENAALREELVSCSDDELVARLLALKGRLHNTTDVKDRARLVRAIEIATFSQGVEPESLAPVYPLVLGVRWPREELAQRIQRRLLERIDAGLVDEVQALLASGIDPKRLDMLGLEYRYVTDLLANRIRSRNDLIQKLGAAIYQFARRQESWFRRMERHGVHIHWIDRADVNAARRILHDQGLLSE